MYNVLEVFLAGLLHSRVADISLCVVTECTFYEECGSWNKSSFLSYLDIKWCIATVCNNGKMKNILYPLWLIDWFIFDKSAIVDVCTGHIISFASAVIASLNMKSISNVCYTYALLWVCLFCFVSSNVVAISCCFEFNRITSSFSICCTFKANLFLLVWNYTMQDFLYNLHAKMQEYLPPRVWSFYFSSVWVLLFQYQCCFLVGYSVIWISCHFTFFIPQSSSFWCFVICTRLLIARMSVGL